MKERPILMSAPMVLAILDGRKTQTRRIIKPQPSADFVAPEEGLEWRGAEYGICGRQRIMIMRSNGESDVDVEVINFPVKPRFFPGDRLWVREAWQMKGLTWGQSADTARYAAGSAFQYRATDNGEWKSYWGKWRPSIHMPRAASRIALEITDIRVERLQDISEKDAIAEGVTPVVGPLQTRMWENPADPQGQFSDPRLPFQDLWKSTNGVGSWEANPWVWIISFQRIEQERKAA